MSIFTRMRLFQKAAMAVLIFFMSLMLYVTVHAHLRKSGNTGIDMGRVQLMRYHAQNQPPKQN